MSKRKLYGCCRNHPTKYSYIDKFYKAPKNRTDFVKRMEDFIRAEYFDDGMDNVHQRRTEPWEHELTNITGVSYSLNKRNRWRLVDELPAIIPKICFDEPSTRYLRGKKTRSEHPDSVVIKGTIGTCPLYSYFPSIPYVARDHPVTFSNSITVAENSNSEVLVEKKNRRHGRQSRQRRKDVSEKPSQQFTEDQWVIQYCIGVSPAKTSYVFRKDRHTRGSDRDNEYLHQLRKNSPSSGYKYGEEMDEYRQMSHDRSCEMEDLWYPEDNITCVDEVPVYNLDALLLAGRAREARILQRKGGKFPLDYEVVPEMGIQDGPESYAWDELDGLSGGRFDTCSVVNSDNSSWELMSSVSDGFEDLY